jgi:hypothetical protein
MENDMNETTTMGLRLPVQAAVDRTTTDVTLVEGIGVDASQNPAGTLPPLPPPIMQSINGPCVRSFGRWLC